MSAGAVWSRFDLGPQAPDGHIHQARVTEIVVAPDAIEQDVPGQHLAGVVDELQEQVELGPGQGDVRARRG